MKNLILLILLSSNCLAANFHAIIIADTNDATIGSSVMIDKRKINTLTSNIASNTGLILKQYNIYGYNYNYNTVKRSLNNLSVRSDDVVMFYYSGHSNNAGGKWPALNLKGRSLKLDRVISSLKAKKPRLLLVIADSCNNLTSRGSSVNNFMSLRGVPVQKKQNYQQLFLKQKGVIIMGAAIPGEYAWGNSQHGGFFTYQLLEGLNQEFASSSAASWNQVVKRAEVPIRLPYGVVQHPQSEVNVSSFTKVQIEKCYYVYNSAGSLCCRKSTGTTCEQPIISKCPYYFFNRSGSLCCRRSTGTTCE